MTIYAVTAPPSANRMWTHTPKGMTKSREYRAWLTAAGWQIRGQKLQSIAGPVSVSLTIPTNGRRDLDNHVKPTLDLLTNLRMIEGDRFKTVKELHLRWHDQPAMLISIESYGQA